MEERLAEPTELPPAYTIRLLSPFFFLQGPVGFLAMHPKI